MDRKTAGELARWVRDPDGMRFAAVADTCYAWYAAQTDAVRLLSEALPVIYSGVALGQVFKGVLKPDPALAFFDGLCRGALPLQSWTKRRRCASCAGRTSPPGDWPRG